MSKLKFNSLSIILAVTFLELSATFAFPQQLRAKLPGDSTSILAKDSKHFVEVGLDLLSLPFQFRSRDWSRVGLAAGGTALLF